MNKKIFEEIKDVVDEKTFEKIEKALEGISFDGKKVIIKKKGDCEHEPHVHVVRKHKHKGEEFHHEHKHHEHRHPEQRHHRRPGKVQKTKLFVSKEEMVNFVNEKGEEGHQIDVFKIEEGLYKVVVIEKRH